MTLSTIYSRNSGRYAISDGCHALRNLTQDEYQTFRAEMDSGLFSADVLFAHARDRHIHEEER